MAVTFQENILFFKQWLKHPTQLGTFAPISKRLAKHAAQSALRCVKEGEHILEIGAGTGRLTRALIKEGALKHGLKTVEIDKPMHTFLTDTLPEVEHIHGDATELHTLLPHDWLSKVGVIVSAIPLMYLKEPVRRRLMDQCFSAAKKDVRIVHVTYSPTSPLKKWDSIDSQPLHRLWMNVPPGFVWQYSKIFPCENSPHVRAI
jgi:phosphatidylethanolamine/phosphatidyl-N-methylethanolamine N-methyltransferase